MPLGQRRQSRIDPPPESPKEAPHSPPRAPAQPPAGSRPAPSTALCPPHPLRPRVGEVVTVHATDLDEHGAGRGLVDGLDLHVPGLLPDEHGKVLISHISPHHPQAWATLQERLSQSPERQIPICAGYGVCGGCTLQHLSYPAQLRWKQGRVRTALGEILIQSDSDEPLRSCVGSPGHDGAGSVPEYRSRVKLIAAREPRSGLLVLGSYLPRTHAVVPMAQCRVHVPGLAATIESLQQELRRAGLLPYQEDLRQGCLRYVLLRETADGAQALSLVVAELPAESQLAGLTSALRQACPQLGSIVLHQNRSQGNALLSDDEVSTEASAADRVLHGQPYLWDELGVIPLRVSARSFLQVNRATAARIYSDVASELAQLASHIPGQGPRRILDVYCGVGGLGLTVLSRIPASQLFGLEWSESAIADAKAAAERMNASAQTCFLAGAAEVRLAEPALRNQLNPLAFALLNPPRRGCTEPVLSALLGLRPLHIAYVSCSPESLARDLRILTAAGYGLRHCTPYDMHPGTPHIESMSLLSDRRSGEGPVD